MDFRKLIYFEAVCREKSFTKAAQRLHITQPSVTMAVRDLEHDLNVCLIDRRRGELTPTPEGEYILQKARHLIQELEQTGWCPDRVRNSNAKCPVKAFESLPGRVFRHYRSGT